MLQTRPPNMWTEARPYEHKVPTRNCVHCAYPVSWHKPPGQWETHRLATSNNDSEGKLPPVALLSGAAPGKINEATKPAKPSKTGIKLSAHHSDQESHLETHDVATNLVTAAGHSNHSHRVGAPMDHGAGKLSLAHFEAATSAIKKATAHQPPEDGQPNGETCVALTDMHVQAATVGYES